MKVCVKCNENYDDEFAFCPKCGLSLVKDDLIKCPKCKKVLEKDFIYCPYCGCELDNNAVSDNYESLETGKNYYYGKGVEKDYSKAREIFIRFAEQGDEEAQTLLGIMYENGEGVEQDSEKAAEWYEKAAEQGYARAQFNIGYLYDNGKGVEQDFEKAAEWYEKAAEHCSTKGLSESYSFLSKGGSFRKRRGKEFIEKTLGKQFRIEKWHGGLNWQ